MKYLKNLQYLIFLVLSILHGSCSKNIPDSNNDTEITKGGLSQLMLENSGSQTSRIRLPRIQFINTTSSSLKANAGSDKIVILPNNSCILRGGWSISGSTVPTLEFKWSQISGPTHCQIENPFSIYTNVIDLSQGVFKFEFQVTSNTHGFSADTCLAIVNYLSNPLNTILIENQSWTGDGVAWGSLLIINNIYNYIPSGSVFKIYIRRDSSQIWEELIVDDESQPVYWTYLNNGEISIWSATQEFDTPDIKIEY